MGKDMPFDGKRMIMGGFESIVDEGTGGGGYVDGIIVPVSTPSARIIAAGGQDGQGVPQHGANRVVESLADDVNHGQVTDFYRAVKAEDGETIAFSFIEWPDKATRDTAWGKIMEDESLRPQGELPFVGKRMFWGGFDKILDTAEQNQTQQAGAPVTA